MLKQSKGNKLSVGPVVIGFFVFVIVGEGACIRLSRHGVPDSMLCSLFWEFGGARGSTVVANLCANALRLRSDMLLTRVLVCRARSYNSI